MDVGLQRSSRLKYTTHKMSKDLEQEDGPQYSRHRQIMVERAEGIGAVAARIDNHINTCETFRRILLGAIGVMISINVGALGFLVSELYVIKGRQDGVLARLESIDRATAADKEFVASRFSAIVQANIQREASFVERFKSVEQTLQDRFKAVDASISDMRRQMYEHEKEERTGPTTWGGPPRR